MIYTILITVVFIAELIIAITIIKFLISLDNKIIKNDELLTQVAPSIKDISVLSRKITSQWVILSQDFVDKVKKDSEEKFLKLFSKFLVGLLVLNLNFKIVKKIKKSKITKSFVKGWSLLESMV